MWYKPHVRNQPRIVALRGEEAAVKYFIICEQQVLCKQFSLPNALFIPFSAYYCFNPLFCQRKFCASFKITFWIIQTQTKCLEDTLPLFLTLNVTCNVHFMCMWTTFVYLTHLFMTLLCFWVMYLPGTFTIALVIDTPNQVKTNWLCEQYCTTA